VRVLQRVRGTLTIIRTLPGQRRIAYLPREQAAALRDQRVRATVRRAVETVPFYRDLFRRNDIDPGEIRTVHDLRQLPLIDKSTVLEDPSRFRSSAVADEETVPFSTSGSTWRRLTVHHDRQSLLENIAYSERQRAVEAALVGKKLRYVVATIAHETLTGRTVDAHYARSAVRPIGPSRQWIPIDEGVERVVDRIGELRPDVLAGFGSYLEEFFKLVAHRGLRLHLPRVVMYWGDPMSAEARSLIETGFGVPVLSTYAAVEAFKVGYFCEHRRGFHLYEDLCDVWIAADDGTPQPAGKRGEVVISNFVNRATVLLNYRLGDLAHLVVDQCPCGRTSPLLSELEGRVSEIVHLPSGDIVHPFAVLTVVRRYEAVTRSQLVQHEAGRFELKVTTVDRAAFEKLQEPLRREVSRVLQGATVEVTSHERLNGGGRGKFVPVVALRR
jgi:phenylacetate-CoA ligase